MRINALVAVLAVVLTLTSPQRGRAATPTLDCAAPAAKAAFVADFIGSGDD